MTRAKELSKILSDGNLTGTLDVVGAFTSLGIDDNATSVAITIDASENVGIGTASPARTLSVESTGNRIATLKHTAGTYAFATFSDTDTTDDGQVRIGALTNDLLAFAGGSERMRIDSSGNVGIGTTSPDAPLDVTRSGDGVIAHLQTSGNHGFEISAPSSTTLQIASKQGSKNLDLWANTLSFSAGGSERMRIDTSGRVGIGESSPNAGLQITSTNNDINKIRLAYANTTNYMEIGRLAGSYRIASFENGQALTFGTTTSASATTEHIRIDSSGNIMFNSGVYSTADARLVTTHDGNAQVGFAIRSTSSVAQSEKMIQFKKDNTSGVTEVGTITSNRTSTSYNTSSDYRLKENVTSDWEATTRLKQLKPSRFNFIADADTTVDGFLAHEVSSIVPEAIQGVKDATEIMTNVVLNADGTRLTDDVTQEKWVAGKLSTTDADGNTVDPIYASDTTWVASKTVPSYQGIDQSKLVPLLVKSLQEALTEIEALKTENETQATQIADLISRVTALENA